MRLSLVVLAALAGACKTQVQSVTPVGSAAAVTAAFMRAVADSNLAQMGALWGTERGPAATTNSPSNWGQRVFIMHSYLNGGTFKVLGEGDPTLNRENRRQVLVELNRGGCTKTVPFTMLQTRDGSWLVTEVDLNAAGIPGRPCAAPAGTPPPPPPPPGTPAPGASFIR